ncbi:unnamed protein product [Macrosiphum euphorbiae]|uniref:Uncharacterized protein n=1 Tax=Macrosiphum euphorbiae TaxID=13131 RepID=A0AAV0VTW0_9HEMI|nr:unnamed protein product [Macrosiphum euphorbiae]
MVESSLTIVSIPRGTDQDKYIISKSIDRVNILAFREVTSDISYRPATIEYIKHSLIKVFMKTGLHRYELLQHGEQIQWIHEIASNR